MVSCYSKKYVVLLTFSILLSQIFTNFLHGLTLLHAENNFNTKLLEFDASKIPPTPPQKSQRTRSLTPQFEYMMVQSVICGYLAIRIRGQTFCVVWVLRNSFLGLFLKTAPRLF